MALNRRSNMVRDTGIESVLPGWWVCVVDQRFMGLTWGVPEQCYMSHVESCGD
jgi:hypothetical protein